MHAIQSPRQLSSPDNSLETAQEKDKQHEYIDEGNHFCVWSKTEEKHSHCGATCLSVQGRPAHAGMLSDFQSSWRAFLKIYILFSHVARHRDVFFSFFSFFCLTKGSFRREKVKYSYLPKENLSISRQVKEL